MRRTSAQKTRTRNHNKLVRHYDKRIRKKVTKISTQPYILIEKKNAFRCERRKAKNLYSSADKRELLICRTFLLSETFVALPDVLVTDFNTLFTVNKSVLICIEIERIFSDMQTNLASLFCIGKKLPAADRNKTLNLQ